MHRTLTAWDPNADATVSTLAISGTRVYAGGSFANIGGQPRSRIAALDTTSGQATPWNPGASDAVYALLPHGTTLYAGGNFLQIGGHFRPGLAALDTTVNTASATDWSPNPTGAVYTLALSGTLLYAGGLFTSIGGQPRNNIAALDTTVNSNNATAWDRNASSQFGGSVDALARAWDDRVRWRCIQFDRRPAAHEYRRAECHQRPGHALNPGADNTVYSLATRGTTVYASGGFSTIGGQPRDGLAALDGASGQVTPWNPGALGTVFSLALGASAVDIGGDFTSVDGLPQAGVAAIDTEPKHVTYLPLLRRQ